MTSQPGLQTITIDILSNNSQSKSNQTMKFGQLVEHNNRNIFLETMQKMKQGDYLQTSFYFLKKLNMR